MTFPVASSTTAVNAPRDMSCWSLVNVRGAYATTARLPEPVTQTLPIQLSASKPGSARVAAVRQA